MPHNITTEQENTVFAELEAFVTNSIQLGGIKPDAHVVLIITLHNKGLCLDACSCRELVDKFWASRPDLYQQVNSMAA